MRQSITVKDILNIQNIYMLADLTHKYIHLARPKTITVQGVKPNPRRLAVSNN